MKMRCLLMAAAAVTAALALSSCNREQISPKTEGERQLTLTVTLPGEAGTRAVFEENKDATGKFLGLKTKWELGDKISVGVMNNNAISTFKAASVSDDGKTATFVGKALAEWGELSDGIEFWSCYPSADMDWRQQDGTLANLPNHDFLWIYSEYSDGKLIPENYYTREVYLFRFPEGFAFCDKEVNGNVTLEISGEMIFSLFDFETDESTPATGENAIQVGPVSVSAGALTDDVYVAAFTDWAQCVKINIGVSPEDGSWVKQYKLSYPTGFNAGQLYTITSVEKLDLVAEAEFVDLGLSVKWAKWNLGATKETDYGDHFAWGETAAKTDYSWDTYFDNPSGDGETFTKYATDKKTKLDLVDDAANATLGGKFRMPTPAEMDALLKLEKELVTDYEGTGIKGCKFTGNGKTIFLPAAGNSPASAGSFGGYWSSSLSESKYAWAMTFFFPSTGSARGGIARFEGLSIRPVSE